MYGLSLQKIFKGKDYKKYDKGLELVDRASNVDTQSNLIEYRHLFLFPNSIFGES